MPHQPYLAYTIDPQFAIGHATDAGRSGKNNEDLYAVFETQFTADSTGFANSKVIVAVVADGIGGSVAGELASDLAIQAVAASFRDTSKPAPLRLEEAIQRANREIYQQSIGNPALNGMGTTIVGAIIGADQFQVGHVGDSRGYLLRNGELHLLTVDHSWAQEAVEAGRLTPAEARVHTNRHVIKRFLGGAESVAVDYKMIDFRHGPLQPDAMQNWPRSERIDLLPGDTLLLCTDGLSDVVDEGRIKSILNRHAPQVAADKLIGEANKAGGPDNITAVIVRKAGGNAPLVVSSRPLLVGTGLVVLLALLVLSTFLLLNGGNGNATQAVAMATDPPETVVVAVTDSPAKPTITDPPTEIPATSVSEEVATDADTPLPVETLITGTIDASGAISALTATAAMTVALTPGVDETLLAGSTPPVTAPVSPEEASLTPIAVLREQSDTEAPVDMVTPLAAVGPTATSRPKSTPAQATSIATIPPTSTSTPTQTAPQRPLSTPVLSPVAQSTGAQPVRVTPTTVPQIDISINLVRPDEGQSFSENDTIEFGWSESSPVPEPYTYELVFWQEVASMEAGGARDVATSRTARTIRASVIGPGRWCWGIYLRNEGGRVRPLTGECRLMVITGTSQDEEKPDANANGNGSGSGGGTKTTP